MWGGSSSLHPLLLFALLLSFPCQCALQGAVSFCSWKQCLADASKSSLLLCLPAPTRMALMPFASCSCHSAADLLLCHPGQTSERFPQIQHTAPAAGSGPVPKGEQETLFFRFLWFLKFSEAVRDGAERGLQCSFGPLTPR